MPSTSSGRMAERLIAVVRLLPDDLVVAKGEDQDAVSVKPLPFAQRSRVLRQLGVPLGLADDGFFTLNPTADVVALKRQHPSTQFAGCDHAVDTTASDTRVHQTRILNLLSVIVEEAAQLLTVNAGLEGLHQLDDKRLLVTDVDLFVRHFRLPF